MQSSKIFDFYEKIENYIVNTADFSIGNSIAMLLTKKSLSKIKYLLYSLKIDQNPLFIGAPDLSFTLNNERFSNGYPTGGKIIWGDGTIPLIPVDLHINCCGTLTGILDDIPDPNEVLRQIKKLSNKDFSFKGLKFQWDFGRKNHFIAIFRSSSRNDRYFFIVHSSSAEFKSDNKVGLGLYPSISKSLEKKSHVLKTKLGPIQYLIDNDAEIFYKQYLIAEQYSKEKREFLASNILNDYKIISNETHFGLTNMNTCLLGCYDMKNNNTIYPFLTTPESNSFLINGMRNFDFNNLSKLNIIHHAEICGYKEKLQNANIIPHGLGLDVDIQIPSPKILENKGYYEIFSEKKGYHLFFNDINNLNHKYNKNDILKKSINLQMCKVFEEIIPIIQFKI